jgi:osmotically-inducible protein OsmY
MIKIQRFITLSIYLTLITSCASIIDATTSQPLQIDSGKRTFGSLIDDEKLETVAKVNIRKASPELKIAHINVVAFNGVILLTGEVGSGKMREQAGNTVRAIHSVRQVFNELQVQGRTSVLSRANDTWLTAKVKAVLLNDKDINSRRIKIVTESGTVYVLGLLSRIEAEKAANTVSRIGGVQKVVKAIEYID